MPDTKEVILDQKKIDRALNRVAHEIIERNGGAESLALIGIITRGAHLARRIAKIIDELEGIEVEVGLMDISLYRDDVHSKLDQPVIQRTDILFPVVDKHIVLVDDVLFTGRTVRAALDQLIDFGRPRSIQLAVLVDRGHRELPIKADYVGANIPTNRADQVVVEVHEKEGQDRVYVERGRGDRSKPGTSAETKKKTTRKRKKASNATRRKGGKK